MNSRTLRQVTDFLDATLRVADFKDDSHNGLQVENRGAVNKVCCGVDATLDFFKEAHRRGASLLVCHHGLSWGDSLKRVTDLNYRRIEYLITRNMALYGCHLPLDAHPRYGNNMQIVRALGLRGLHPFGWYHGSCLSFCGDLPAAGSLSALQKKLSRVLGRDVAPLAFGRSRVRRVAVISGGGGSAVSEAARIGADVLVTGEISLAARHEAADWGLNVLLGGHYATETFGVRALAGLLHKKFKVPCEFIDLKITH